jgi:tRNA G18 (ribose-2'-O)-methylase SpoU
MSIVKINDLNDPRLDSYRDLRNHRRFEGEGLFVVEGETLVGYALEAGMEFVSCLVAEERLASIPAGFPVEVPCFAIPQAAFPEVAGYRFHRGLMAMARRRPLSTIDEVLAGEGFQRIVVCPDLTDPENLGTILRLSAGLGADAVLLGPEVPDVWSRRVVRVSMGAVWKLPVARFERMDLLAAGLQAHGCQLVGTVLQGEAVELGRFVWPERAAILMGNEAFGLDDQTRSLCQARVTLKMCRGVDSLNVATAAAIFLHDSFARR